MSRDPRSSFKLSARDIEAFVFIGEGFEIAQYQLHAGVFAGLSEVVVSRFVRRWAGRGLLAVDRWNNIGVNKLRLTSTGRDELVARGVAGAAQLFTPRKPVAPKDAAHTMWINDLRIVLRDSASKFDLILPAWMLQRRFAPAPRAIPDLLAIRKPDASGPGQVLAAEVDLGGERLNAIFLPKLLRLQDLMYEWAGNAPASILILTKGAQRAAILQRFAGEALTIPTAVALLPDENGREGLRQVRETACSALAGVNSECSDELTSESAEAADFQ